MSRYTVGFVVLFSVFAASAWAQDDEKNVNETVLVESVVLSDMPAEKTAQIPVKLGDTDYNLDISGSFYYLSKRIEVKKEFPNRDGMVEGLRKLYCADAPSKHEWSYKMKAMNPEAEGSTDPGFDLGSKKQAMIVGLLKPQDNAKKVQPSAVGRLIVTYRDSRLDRRPKGEKIDWGFIQAFTDDFPCKEE